MERLQEVDARGAVTAEQLDQLAEAFAVFNATTEKLQSAHDALTARVATLDRELEEKNRQLEATNRQLSSRMAELSAVRSFLVDVIGSIHHGIATVDLAGKVTMWNRAAESMTGHREKDVLGRPLLVALGVEEGSPLGNFLGREERTPRFEARLKHRDGPTVWIAGSTSPLYNSEQCRSGTTLFFSDLTQLYHLEEQARRSDRLRALGELAAGVAHEMRNPLTTIRGFIQILPDEYEDAAFRLEFSSNVLREIDRLVGLTEHLLDFAKPTSAERRPLDLREYVEEILGFLGDRFRRSETRVCWRAAADGILADIDRDRLRQVFLNLFTNAEEAMGPGGSIDLALSTEVRTLERGGRRIEVEVAVIEVADHGPGIEPGKVSVIFDPFFSTKHHGTGLGLAISHRIVEEHGGLLEVDNREGGGACFRVVLPRSGLVPATDGLEARPSLNGGEA